MLTYEVRQIIRAEISRIRKERLLRLPRNLYGAAKKPKLDEPGDEAPWFPILPHLAPPAHRNLPSLEDYERG